MNLLIPYIQKWDHHDPFIEEFTYGDIGRRAKKLKKDLEKGDYVFFHTTINGIKLITAYYVVDRVLDIASVIKERNLLAKHKNPHIEEYMRSTVPQKAENVVLFGDPISSKVLRRPLRFDKNLARKLSLSIKFPEGRSNGQVIGSATRSWRALTRQDITILLKEIMLSEQRPFVPGKMISTEEVTDILERDIENYIEKNSGLIDKGLILKGRQLDTQVGRIDMLFENDSGDMFVVELKLGKIGREAINQLRRYLKLLKKETNKKVKGILVCSGVMQTFQDEFARLRDISIFRYGWQMKVSPWPDK